MNVKELKVKLDKNGIPRTYYFINESISPNICIKLCSWQMGLLL